MKTNISKKLIKHFIQSKQSSEVPVATATLNLGNSTDNKLDVPVGFSRDMSKNILFKTNSNHIKSKSHYDFMKPVASPDKTIKIVE